MTGKTAIAQANTSAVFIGCDCFSRSIFIISAIVSIATNNFLVSSLQSHVCLHLCAKNIYFVYFGVMFFGGVRTSDLT